MTINEAITKATEAGYCVKDLENIDIYFSGANSEYSVWTRKDNESSVMVRVEETFLDPCFCQALGRALGWQHGCEKSLLAYEQWWRGPWHRFLDCLADGKTAEDFFQNFGRPTSENK